MNYYLYLHMQKKNNTIKLFLDLTGFADLNIFFGLGPNNLHEFGKFGATASNGTESSLAVQFFFLVHVSDFSNQFVGLRSECTKNLNLLDSKYTAR